MMKSARCRPTPVTDLAVRPVSVLSAPLPPPDEATKRRNLARMKRRASGLLLLSTAVWIASTIWMARYPWLAYVRATAEASMIGGVADWFAVTALFRHPLGIPIPHTAIVAARKDQIGRSLGNFVSRHFLSRDVLGRATVVAARGGASREVAGVCRRTAARSRITRRRRSRAARGCSRTTTCRR